MPVADCIEFLAALFNCRADGPGRGPTDDAQLVSEFDPRAETIAARAAAELAGLPVGFGHGDFWAQNLLVDNGCLTGVVDWDAAGPGRLPLIDLLHLTMSREQARRRLASVGETIVSVLLPWARRGGDEQARSLFRRLVGGDADPVVLEALVCVYWLGYVAYQIRLYRDRSEPKWLEPNVLMVADALAV